MSTDGLQNLFHNEVIRASAGTGKTFALSNRFLQLLASGASCESILATTFTRMGAGEILDRIVQRLADAALSESAAAKLAGELNWTFDQTRVQALLRNLITNIHRLQIGTLDAFFHRIAQSFSLELDLPDDWRIAEQQQIALMHDKVIQDVLHEDSVINLLHMMMGGEAGRRIADLVRTTVNDIYEVYQDSDKAAWNRLPECNKFLTQQQIDQIKQQLETIEYGHKTQTQKAEEELQLIDAGRWLELANSQIFSAVATGKNSYCRKLPVACIEAYQKLIPQCRAHVVNLLIRWNTSTYALLDEFGRRLEEDKNKTGELRFDDVTRRLEQYIVGQGTDGLSFRLDHTVDHLLLDEFQDTSIPQWKVIKPFADRTTQPDTTRSFFCVGDLKQAIFSWRGGVAEIFDLVDRELSNVSDAQQLTISYRSSPPVIETVNQVFGNLHRYQPKNQVVEQAVEQWGTRFEKHSTTKTDLPGYVTLEYAENAPEDEPWTSRDAVRNDNVLEATVERVRRLVQEMPDRSIGVLVRTNETIGQLIFMLQHLGIAASEEGGNALTDAAAVEYVLSALTLADHPGDSIARFHLSHSPLAKKFSLQPEDDQNQSDNYNAAVNAAREIRTELTQLGYGPTVEQMARLLTPQCTRRELLRLQQLVQQAYNFETSTDQTKIKLRPAKFVAYIRDEFRARDPSSARVRVMTIHQAKGLEFDIVILPMLYNKSGWLSHRSDVVVGRKRPTDPVELACRYTNEGYRALLPQEFQDAFDEDRRSKVRDHLCVLYVALTRAVHATHVILSYSAKPGHIGSDALLLSTLVPKMKDTDRQVGIMYEHGDREWYRNVSEDVQAQQEVDEWGLDSFYLSDEAQLTQGSISKEVRSGRGVPTISPSRLEGGDFVQLSGVFRTLDNKDALVRGTMIHGCFERVKWLDEQLPTQAQLLAHLQSIDAAVPDHALYIQQFEEMRNRAEVVQLLSRASYQQTYLPDFAPPGETIIDALRAEVQNERPFAVNLDEGLMQGFIDRLVLVYQGDRLIGADVIDYKTDPVDEQSMGQRIEHYRPQLEGYRLAVSKFASLPLEKIAARIVFLETGNVVTLETPSQSSPAKQQNHESKVPRDQSDKPATKPKVQVKKPKFKHPHQMKLWSED